MPVHTTIPQYDAGDRGRGLRWFASSLGVVAILALLFFDPPPAVANDAHLLDPMSQETLAVPPLSVGEPRAGKRTSITPPEYQGKEIFHVIHLPDHWEPGGEALPIIFEYTGNAAPRQGSTGEPQDGALGFALSGGKWIWVSLPYISKDKTRNETSWWGDIDATVEYAKTNVPRIIREFGADPNAVFLSGFSRGAIAVNFIGLHDDEISSLWTAFVAHDHFDGAKEWPRKNWGSPLANYRREALDRMRRIGDRPYLITGRLRLDELRNYIQSVLPESNRFTYTRVNSTEELAGPVSMSSFPNEIAKTSHTDRWALLPSPYRTTIWRWMNEQLEASRKATND